MSVNHIDEILIIGDSMIQNVSCILSLGAYRGDTLKDIGNHLKFDMIPAIYDKQVIYVHAGTNDILTLTVAEMMEDLHTLFERIRERNRTAKLFYSAVLQRPCDFKITQDKILEFNREVIKKESEWRFTFIHTYNFFQRDRLPRRDMYYTDNLHPSDSGAIKMSTTWAKRLHDVRMELGIAHNESGYFTPTVVTIKPKKGAIITRVSEKGLAFYSPKLVKQGHQNLCSPQNL